MSERSRSQQEALSFLEELMEPDVESMTKEEIACDLAAFGANPTGLHKRLSSRARELAKKERQKTGSAPAYLREAIEQLDWRTRLPRKANAAIEKAAEWIGDLGRSLPSPSKPVVLESYRKGDKDLTKKDRELIDAERDALLKQIGDSNET